ncbi:DNA polymerase Y family protein [Roseomonas sp. KE0001]|uniref:Y-family DNA polymerase n=1 Tax=Roseomonas sp. KE0001 TaxID=2479201 RepID=UPI0018E015E0|nr:DNA polymerase Y family protein [Roseomonas sp. KE0001]MBI0434595.1 DNA polymerase Y family protein [Roseomonas sp. KE0001]
MEAAPRRILALHLPWLESEGLDPGPLLLWGIEGPRRLVMAVDPAAARLGLRAGMALADARAMVPQATVLPHDPHRAAARLTALALHLRRFTPLVATEAPDTLLLDTTGCEALAGGEAALARQALAALEACGHAALAAMAGNAAAAAALARHAVPGEPPRILPPGTEAEALSPLPLERLRLPAEMLRRLRGLGLRRIGEVLAQPRGPLTRRFGPGLLARLDLATGAARAALRPLAPPPVFAATLAPPEPLITRAGLDAALARLLPELCHRLEAAGQGLRRLRLALRRVDGSRQEIGLGTGGPVRDPAHLARLLREKLEGVAPGFGIERLEVRALETQPLEARQSEGLADGEAAAREALERLLDRLGQRLPVWRAQPCASHWPEQAVRAVSPFAVVRTPSDWDNHQDGPWGGRPRPVWLLARPEPVEAAPDGLVWRGRPRPLRHREGPERLEAEWWGAAPERPPRDYWRVECEDGLRLWLCRSEARWFLHGLFA